MMEPFPYSFSTMIWVKFLNEMNEAVRGKRKTSHLIHAAQLSSPVT